MQKHTWGITALAAGSGLALASLPAKTVAVAQEGDTEPALAQHELGHAVVILFVVAGLVLISRLVKNRRP